MNKNCQHNSYEHFFIELKGSSYNVIIGSLYRPPNTDIDKFLTEYNDTLERISLEKNKEVILGMDHNLDLIIIMAVMAVGRHSGAPGKCIK